jgi:hypothetical protein
MQSFTKDPDAKLTYTVDWTAALGANTISASSWTAPSGLTLAGSSFTDVLALAQLSGGTRGVTYTVVNRITMAPSGDIDDESLSIAVEDT